MTGAVIRALVVDDQEVVRAGFAALLETQPDITVVASAADGRDAVRLAREHTPEVVLMDVRMPELDGIEATRQICAEASGDAPRILILTTFDLDEYVYDALHAGASGFLLKDVPAETLFEAVRVIAAGDALLAPAITRRLIAEFARLRPRLQARPARLETLTPRETEILVLVAEGLSNHEIASRLVLSDGPSRRTSATSCESSGCATGRRPWSSRTKAVSSSLGPEYAVLGGGSPSEARARGLSCLSATCRERLRCLGESHGPVEEQGAGLLKPSALGQ